jgi:hypothetical protein
VKPPNPRFNLYPSLPIFSIHRRLFPNNFLDFPNVSQTWEQNRHKMDCAFFGIHRVQNEWSVILNMQLSTGRFCWWYWNAYRGPPTQTDRRAREKLGSSWSNKPEHSFQFWNLSSTPFGTYDPAFFVGSSSFLVS